METKTGLPEAAGFGPTQNDGGVAKTEMAPKLDVQRELDGKRADPPIASVAPRRARTLRVAALMIAILAVLGIGWGAGLKTQESLNVAQVSRWLQDTAGALVSNLDAQRQQMIAGIESLASTSPSQEAISPDGAPKGTAEAIETVARGLFVKIDKVGASSERAIAELGTGIERLNRSIERSQRELSAKLDELQQRLERVEGHSAGASNERQAKPPEKPAAENPAALPLQPAAPATAAAAPKPTSAPVKRIENWAVREVVDGMAILAGPRGLIGVFNGDVVPGIGRVQSISRRGGRWVVATSTGVITGR